jgi:two-component system LytT family response regulator
MIKGIIIDDEMHCIETLNMLLKEHCPDISVVDQCKSALTGLSSIAKHKPDILFLDIEMPNMNGFEMLEQFSDIPFSIIFTTSYDQYAIKAIRFSALDYLLKPIDPNELVSAVHKVRLRKQGPSAEQIHMLIDKIQSKEQTFTKVAVPTSEGFELLPTDQIISCEADDNYTSFNIKDKRKIIACRSLKDVEEQLTTSFSYFIRVHHSYLVNLNEVSKYVRGEGGYLVMSDGTTVNVSRSRKEALLKTLKI